MAATRVPSDKADKNVSPLAADSRPTDSPPNDPYLADTEFASAAAGSREEPSDPALPASVLITNLLEEWREDTISVGNIMEGLQRRGYSILMLILALPNLFPIYVPGLSPITGLPLIYLCWQLCARRRIPYLPQWLTDRSMATETLRHVVKKLLPVLQMVEHVLRPRLPALVTAPWDRLLGIFCLVMLAILINPLPATNWLPALSISCMALALLERDGLFVLIAFFVGIGAVIFYISYMGLLFLGISSLYDWLLL